MTISAPISSTTEISEGYASRDVSYVKAIKNSCDFWLKTGLTMKFAPFAIQRTRGTMAVGVNVEVPDIKKRIEQGPVIVIGDRAPEDLKTHPGVTLIPGCPPTANLIPTF